MKHSSVLCRRNASATIDGVNALMTPSTTSLLCSSSAVVHMHVKLFGSALFNGRMDFLMEPNSGHCLRGMLICILLYGENIDANRRSFGGAGGVDRAISP